MSDIETQSSADEEKVGVVIQAHSEMEGIRVNFEAHWNDIAHFVWPEMRNTFKPGMMMNEMPGVRKTSRQLDATPQLALNQFGAIMDSLLTPRNQTWHAIGTDDEEINKDRDAVLWYETLNRQLFKHRYAPGANFASQNQLQYKGLGAFGTGTLFVDGQIDGRGLRYKALGVGETFIRENHQGIIDEILRYFTLTGKQAMTQFTEEELPSQLFEDMTKHPGKRFAFMNYVQLNRDLDPTRLDFKGKRFSSVTINVDLKWLIRESGFNTFPYIPSRYEQAPEETYGRSPAMMALPAMHTLNAQKSIILKQGHRTADPILLTHDDGMLDGFDLQPGAINAGGVDENGRLMVQTLPIGNVQVARDMMDEERDLINAAFLVHLFQILAETPRMTATEVIERTREKGILLAPTVGRQQSEYLGPLVDREIDVLVEQGLVPPMPPILLEAEGEYTLTYNSPLSRAMRAEEASGIVRTLEHILPVIQTTQDPSPLDNFDMDVITTELADINAVPKHWMKSPDVVAAIREDRAEAAERAAQTAEAPGEAALITAEANAQKA